MRSVLLVVLSNLRYRKKQNLLVGLSIILSTLLLTTAIGIFMGINKPFDLMFDRLQASHILLEYDIRRHDPAEITAWFKQQPEVEFIAPPSHYFLVSEPLTYKLEKVDIMVRITEMGNHQDQYDQLLSMEENESSLPGWGEVWLPKHFSVKYQMRVGDTLHIPLSTGLYPLIISNIVVDPHYASGLINPNRIWIAPGMLPFMVQSSELNQMMQGVRMYDKADIEKVWTRYNKEMPYAGNNLQYKLFKSVFTSIYRIIGFVIVLFSVLAIVVSGYIISAIVTNSVLADSQLTGSLKAIGYKSGQVTRVYLVQYIVIASMAIPIGLAASFFSIRTILQSIMRSVGVLNLNLPLTTIFLASSLFFLLFITVLIRIFTRKTGKIPPAQALKSVSGDSNIQRGKTRPFLKIQRAPMPLWIALKLLFDSPRKALLSTLSLAITAFILGFAVNTSNSFSKIAEYKSLWGFDGSDMQVTRATAVILPITHKQFLRQLHGEELIIEVVPYSYYELTIPGSSDAAPRTLQGKVYEEDPGLIGLSNISGRHPMDEKEISLCIGTAHGSRKTVGDSILVLMENEARYLDITGIYQDISNMGEGFRLSSAAVLTVNPLFEPATYSMILKEADKKDSLISALRKRYGEAIQVELTIEEQLGFLGVTKSINASMILISLFFIGIMMVAMFNDIFLNIWEYRKTIGVYKLIGYTQKQLQYVMIWKSGVTAMGGIAIGLPLLLFSGPHLMGSITSGFGVVDFPFALTLTGTIAAYLILIGVAILSSRWASSSMKRINPRILVNE